MLVQIKSKQIIIIQLALFLVLSACGLTENRTFVGQMESGEQWMIPGKDFRVVPGDSGQAYRTRQEVQARTPLFGHEALSFQESRALEEELRVLEEAIAPEEYQQYMTVKDSLPSVSDKIYYLKIPSAAERNQYMVLRSQGRNPAGFMNSNPQLDLAVRNRDLLLGMHKDQVMQSWGRPSRVDVAGNPRYENERWSYYRGGQFKIVYFESGRVQGWDNGEGETSSFSSSSY